MITLRARLRIRREREREVGRNRPPITPVPPQAAPMSGRMGVRRLTCLLSAWLVSPPFAHAVRHPCPDWPVSLYQPCRGGVCPGQWKHGYVHLVCASVLENAVQRRCIERASERVCARLRPPTWGHTHAHDAAWACRDAAWACGWAWAVGWSLRAASLCLGVRVGLRTRALTPKALPALLSLLTCVPLWRPWADPGAAPDGGKEQSESCSGLAPHTVGLSLPSARALPRPLPPPPLFHSLAQPTKCALSRA